MISRREKLLIQPWQMQRYENHKRKVKSARAVIDFSTPVIYPHVVIKQKKIQAEKERMDNIKKENVRLLQRLGNIMTNKRLENFWQNPRPNFLNREKIFKTRPKTTLGRIENVTATQSSTPFSIQSHGLSAARCATCSGKPVKKNKVAPEERIPWEPPKKSWNRCIMNGEYKKHTYCPLCCRV